MASKYRALPTYVYRIENRILTDSEVHILASDYPQSLKEKVYVFPSKLEARVYLELRQWFSDKRIIPQVSVEAIPPCLCYPKGKKHKVDFGIKANTSSDRLIAYVEAKGYLTETYPWILSALEKNNKEVFDKYFIVFDFHGAIKGNVLKGLKARTNKVLTIPDLRLSGLPT